MGPKWGLWPYITVLKFRDIKWLSKSTQWWMPAPSQILLPLVFCRWDLDALEKKTQPKKTSNSPSTICLYISLSDPRYKFLLRQSSSEEPQDFTCPSSTDSSHGQPCHSSLFNVILLSDDWSVWLPSWLRAQNFLQQKLHDGSTNQLPFHWLSLNEELMWVNWEGGHLCWALVS